MLAKLASSTQPLWGCMSTRQDSMENLQISTTAQRLEQNTDVASTVGMLVKHLTIC